MKDQEIPACSQHPLPWNARHHHHPGVHTASPISSPPSTLLPARVSRNSNLTLQVLLLKTPYPHDRAQMSSHHLQILLCSGHATFPASLSALTQLGPQASSNRIYFQIPKHVTHSLIHSTNIHGELNTSQVLGLWKMIQTSNNPCPPSFLTHSSFWAQFGHIFFLKASFCFKSPFSLLLFKIFQLFITYPIPVLMSLNCHCPVGCPHHHRPTWSAIFWVPTSFCVLPWHWAQSWCSGTICWVGGRLLEESVEGWWAYRQDPCNRKDRIWLTPRDQEYWQ